MTTRLIAFGSLLLLALTGCAATTAPAAGPVPLVPGDHLRHLKVNGEDRSYLVHVPPKYDPKKATPVVLIYHGACMDARAMVGFCGLNKKADASEFVAVYPNGLGFLTMLFFNAWAVPSPKGRPADDVKFTARVLDDLATVVNVDAKRVYATGMSNGGMMVYRLAAELSDRIAAIAPVGGTMCIDKPNPKRPVPIIHFHGTADGLVPFTGPNKRTPKFLTFKSVDSTVKTWANLDGCPEKPEATNLPDTAKDGTTVTQEVYGPGKDGAEVVLYVIKGGGHTWPGKSSLLFFLGKSTRNISANDLIWEFFQKHPMKVAPIIDRTLTIGMSLEDALSTLTATRAHETGLDMKPPGDGKELKCFELADGRLVCLIASKGVVVEVSVCGDAGKPKAGRVWTKVEKVGI